MTKYPILLFLIVLGISSCTLKRKPNHQDTRFAKYISGYSSGTQSATAMFRIELAQTPVEETRQKLSDSVWCAQLFETAPSVKGKAWYDGERSIFFQPERLLESNTQYLISFHLQKVNPVEKDLKHFVFTTQTYQQNLQIKELAIQPHDETSNQYYFLHGVLQFADELDTQIIRKNLQIRWHGKKQNYMIHSLYSNQYEIHLDSLERTQEASSIQVVWQSKDIVMQGQSERTLVLPAKSDYTISSYEVVEEEEQYLNIVFSDPLQLQQQVDGLIQIDNQSELDIAQENSLLRIHVKQHLEGLHKVRVCKGLKNVSGYSLPHDSTFMVDFGIAKPKLRLSHAAGNILPNSQGLFLPFDALGVHTVDVRVIKVFENNIPQFLQVNDLDGSDELRRVGSMVCEKTVVLTKDSSKAINHWKRYVLALDKLFTADPSSIYRIQIRFKKKYTSCACNSLSEDPVQEEAVYLDDSSIESEDDDENYRAENVYDDTYETWSGFVNNYSPCEKAYYSGMAISKNILASDIGLILKQGKNTHWVYATDLISAAPRSGVKIYVLDYQNQIKQQGVTNAQGYCQLAATDNIFLIKAVDGAQRGYLKLRNSVQQNLTKFDINGVQVDKKTSAFLYAERGVWRPGDSIFLHAIVRSQSTPLPDHYPIQFEVENPQGQLIEQRTVSQHVHFTYPLYFATSLQAITGTYIARVKIGNATYEKNIQIESVKPNRLKINYRLKDSVLSTWNGKDTLFLNASWLSGSTSAHLKVEVTVQHKPAKNYFTKFPDYSFFNLEQDHHWNSFDLFSGNLDTTGNAGIQVDVQHKLQNLSHMNVITKVYEPSGEYSIDNTSVYGSPFKKYTGISIGDGLHQPFLLTGKNYALKLRTVNANQQADSTSNMRLRVYHYTNTWWWQENEHGVNDYMSRSVKVAIKDTVISIGLNGISIPFQASRSGRYVFLCEDLVTGQQASTSSYFDNTYWEGQGDKTPEGAAQLMLSSNKTHYRVGDEVIVHIPNTTPGKALVCVEKGTEVLSSTWISTSEGQTNYSFTCTAAMTPNVYIHVTLIRPHEQTAKRLPIRMYGVLPVMVFNPSSQLQPIVQCANEVQPGKPFTIEVKEAAGKPMTYSLLLVDEGLTDLTHFKTPDAWLAFNAKQKLQVKTWDLYSEVIGAYAGSLKTKLNIGGDAADEQESYENKANRFKPLVQCIGLFHLEKGTRRHTVVLPSYLGKVKLMLVANKDMAFGSAEKSIVVKQPLMLLSTLPRVLMTGNKLLMPVTVFANAPQINLVQIEVQCDRFIHCARVRTAVQFNQEGEQVITVPMEVGQAIGISHLRIKAHCKQYTFTEDIDIDIKSPNPYTEENNHDVIESGKSLRLTLPSKGVEGSYRSSVTLSTIPDFGLSNKLDYLIQYPHGCAEQTTSAALPQLYLDEIQALSDSEVKACRLHINQAIAKLSLFQIADGSFSYWPSQQQYSAFATCYIGDFLAEAMQRGYTISPYVKDRMLAFLNKQSNTAVDQDEWIAAYQLYVLAKWQMANRGAMNRLKESGIKHDLTRIYLAKAYLLSGQISAAKQMSMPITSNTTFSKVDCFYSDLSNHLEWLELMIMMKDSRVESHLNKVLSQSNQLQQLNTRECAAVLKVMSMYFGNSANQPMHISYLQHGKTVVLKTPQKLVSIPVSTSSIEITNAGSKLYVHTRQRYIPTQQAALPKSKGVQLQVNYYTLQRAPLSMQQVKQGTDFTIEAVVKNTEQTTLTNLVYRYMLPSGWQMVKEKHDLPDNDAYTRMNDFMYFHYFNLKPGESKTIRFVVNATYCGTYSLPRAQVESMYQAAIRSECGGGEVRIE